MPSVLIRVGLTQIKVIVRNPASTTTSDVINLLKAQTKDKQILKQFEECDQYELREVVGTSTRHLGPEEIMQFETSPIYTLHFFIDGNPLDSGWYSHYQNSSLEEDTCSQDTIITPHPTKDPPSNSGGGENTGDNGAECGEEGGDSGDSGDSTEVSDEDSQATERPAKRRRKSKQLPDVSEPKWSPFLRKEFDEGRGQLHRNTIIEEMCWHVVDQLDTWDLPQGIYAKYAKKMLKLDHLTFLQDIATENPFAGVASSMSRFMRNERGKLKKRRQDQAERTLRQQNAVISEDQLEVLKNGSNLPQVVKVLKETFRIRRDEQLVPGGYQAVLTKYPCLAKPKVFMTELQMIIDTQSTQELREEKLGTMISKLKSVEGLPADEEITGKKFCELVVGVQSAIVQSKFRNRPPPIILKQTPVGSALQLDLRESTPFNIVVFHSTEGNLDYLCLMGKREKLLNYKKPSFMEIATILYGAHKVFKEDPPPQYEYLIDFLGYAVLDQKIKVQQRFPKRLLNDYINLTYALM